MRISFVGLLRCTLKSRRLLRRADALGVRIRYLQSRRLEGTPVWLAVQSSFRGDATLLHQYFQTQRCERSTESHLGPPADGLGRPTDILVSGDSLALECINGGRWAGPAGSSVVQPFRSCVRRCGLFVCRVAVRPNERVRSGCSFGASCITRLDALLTVRTARKLGMLTQVC